MEIPLAVPLLNEELGKGHAYPFCHVPHKKTGNYIRVDTDFILNDNLGQFGCQLSSIEGRFCFCSNEMQLCRIWRAKQN